MLLTVNRDPRSEMPAKIFIKDVQDAKPILEVLQISKYEIAFLLDYLSNELGVDTVDLKQFNQIMEIFMDHFYGFLDPEFQKIVGKTIKKEDE